MKTNLYTIECITNLHVGSGDVNFNLIDNEVQKDTVLNCPVIHASGVKGALRSWYEQNKKLNVDFIFGSSHENSKDSGSQKGEYKFLEAMLLSRPVRVSKNSSGKYFYLNATSIEVLNAYIDLNNALFPEEKLESFSALEHALSGVEVEEVEGHSVSLADMKLKRRISEILGHDEWVVFNNKQFATIDLPVVARNYLEKGISKNLWYEEFVPHHSKFYMAVVYPNECHELEEINNQVIQFGGNASIGYGLCKIKKVK